MSPKIIAAAFALLVISAQAMAAPTPVSVTLTPSAVSLPDNALNGSIVAAVSVAMSDKSTFIGQLVAFSESFVTISANNIVLDRNLTSADDGGYQWGVFATQNGITVEGTINVAVMPGGGQICQACPQGPVGPMGPRGATGATGQPGSAFGTPVSSSAPCNKGDSLFDASYIYFCTATNTWVRMAYSGASF